MENQHRKISGYRELDQSEIDAMNEIKALGPKIESVLDGMPESADPRWKAIAKRICRKGLWRLLGLLRSRPFFDRPFQQETIVSDVRQALPCPFCGSTDLVDGSWYIDDEEVDAIECNQCKAGAPAAVWNQRLGPDEPQ